MPTGPGKRKDAAPRVDDQDFVTSDDLFGDMVDAPMPERESPAFPDPLASHPCRRRQTRWLIKRIAYARRPFQ